MILGWARTVRARLLAAGGEILATISGTVVGAFDPADTSDLLDVAMDLVEEAERQQLAIVIGIALGTLKDGAGRAIEVAEALAARGQSGEVVLDPAARERAEGLFLFGRQVSTGVGGPRGSVVDRAHRLDTVGEAIGKLARPPIAPITAEHLEALVSLLASRESPAVVLRGPVGAGALELVSAAMARLRPRLLLPVGSAAGGIAPLASLRYALGRSLGADDAVIAACGDDAAGRSAGRVLRVLLRGGMPPCDAVADALATLLARAGTGARDARSWVFLTPLAMVDAASLDVLLGARAIGAPIALIARYPVDAKLPTGLADPVRELELPPLRTSDARAVAQTVLGDATDPELARRIAVLGGETPLGVVEVARALIASGDLVVEGDGFVWRGAPRGGMSAIPLEEVVDERMSRLEDEPRRLLEAVCVSPEGATRELVEAVAARDGVSEKARARALDRLTREAWLSPEGGWPAGTAPYGAMRPHPSSSFLRRFVVQGMPPARAAELHRFVAEALLERGADDVTLPSLRAELAYYEIEGGLEARGSARLMEIGRGALETGYRRAASRIAMLLGRLGASASDVDALSRASATVPPKSDWDEEDAAPPSAEIALDELEGTGKHAVRDTEPPTEQVSLDTHDVGSTQSGVIDPRGEEDDRRSSFAAAAEEAVRSHDLVALDQLLQRAVASGSDMAAVSRFRALADLMRGDLGAARLSLAKARGYRGAAKDADPRQPLAEGAVALRGGDATGAVRLALRALALARRAGDRKGETTAMRMLAACLRALGRADDASRIESVAQDA
ncbi:hypothetical protein [Sandaracinus amylolyticus]|uniref:hypothetical protein n=1 Tax=Sandaracinus amylolyticus TaxID=927083 RepID=UPI001F25EB5F|nr:hypothetical protein [Sandaracinus amylolyticus]UJR79468.1 Transcriptional regulator, SARP family protein [Sandaracinus amylolyticus]